MKQPQPAPLYYLHNYRALLSWVRSRYEDVLSEEEKAYADQFQQLSEPAQALLTRLICRKGEHFRVSKLRYEEIPALADALYQLIQMGWVKRNPEVTFDALFNCLTRPELTAWLGKYAGTKAQWQVELEALLDEKNLSSCYPWNRWLGGDLASLPKAADLIDDLVAVTIMPLSEIYSLLFFGNHYQALSEFVLAELGIFQYEQVAFSDSCRSFTQRAHLEAYRQLQRAREQFERDADLSNALASLPNTSALPVWLVHRVDRFSFQLGYRHEQHNNYEQALSIYQRCGFIEARARRVRVLEKLGRVQEAYTLLEVALLAPHNEAELQQLSRAQPRLQRALGTSATKPSRFNPVSNSLLLPMDNGRVEQAVAEHLHSASAPVFWTENNLWTGLFGLLFWPAIFAPVQGAFFNPFQFRPKDLYHQSFVASRSHVLQACWQELSTGQYKSVLPQRYREKRGLQSPFVNWSQLTEPLLDLALRCISTPQLAVIFQRMLFDLKANTAGFPDLIQFFPEQRSFKLIEVKGPGDKLQDNQLRWLAFFQQENIAAEVCYVQWDES